MSTRWIAALTALTCLAWGCQDPPEATPEKVPAATEATTITAAPAKPAPKPAAAKPAARPPAKAATTPPPKPTSKLVRWDAPLDWMDWDAGLAKAKASKLPILLMVYADW
jgi:hypothetical protein